MDKLKRFEEKLNVKLTPEGFMEHWEKAIKNSSWIGQDRFEQLIIMNLLILNKEVTQLKAELQEIKSISDGLKQEDLFLSLLALWITSHPGQDVTARELYNDLTAISQDKGLSFDIPDSRQLGVKIKQHEEELKQKYSLTSRTGAGNVKFYNFKILSKT